MGYRSIPSFIISVYDLLSSHTPYALSSSVLHALLSLLATLSQACLALFTTIPPISLLSCYAQYNVPLSHNSMFMRKGYVKRWNR